jgi:dolichol-phosphate mannosyltransferase
LKKLSVIIPARDEADNLPTCIRGIDRELEKHDVVREILVIDDGSIDNTLEVIEKLTHESPTTREVRNQGQHGFGCPVRLGFRELRLPLMAD